MSLLIKGVTVVNAAERLENIDVLMVDGKIQRIAKEIQADATIIDGTGKYLLPGFIDMHIHGSVRCDAMDASDEGLHTMAASLLREGTTSFLATTMTQSPENIEAALAVLGDFKPTLQEAEMVGVHLEGPFVSKKRAGAQPLEHITPPDMALFRKWQQLSGHRIKEITIAPEEPGGMEAVKALHADGVVVSIGHSDATFDEVVEAVELGVSQGTHLYNQMRPFHHREPGVIGATWLLPEIKAELIADFIHSHPKAVLMAYKMKTAAGIILITDAMRAKGMPYGDYDLGGQLVHVTETGAHLPNGSLAGSVLTMDQAVRNMHQATNCSLEELVQMSSFNAAQQLQMTNKGRLVEQADADAVLLDERLTLVQTVKAGNIVYEVKS
ncbi:N-acetylglucosamine-6-phosphate deacetylase [Kurthia sp. 3B1D]|uniref:N-acetylglucosamine-6-phosphate deacetylase n=1 Tax=Candidatus Kurthia intestinigallinarum TaxID=1562256 RepID=A0A433RQ67_9BACL|nr:N-acetylglucosamine-6-phosphate deacetylase [Kurthia sp. 3B1D]RUS52553.1 N-acetylglucosamine-6-phosphate deacetylase [Kurthia sp. 3B1D]